MLVYIFTEVYLVRVYSTAWPVWRAFCRVGRVPCRWDRLALCVALLGASAGPPHILWAAGQGRHPPVPPGPAPGLDSCLHTGLVGPATVTVYQTTYWCCCCSPLDKLMEETEYKFVCLLQVLCVMQTLNNQEYNHDSITSATSTNFSHAACVLLSLMWLATRLLSHNKTYEKTTHVRGMISSFTNHTSNKLPSLSLTHTQPLCLSLIRNPDPHSILWWYKCYYWYCFDQQTKWCRMCSVCINLRLCPCLALGSVLSFVSILYS